MKKILFSVAATTLLTTLPMTAFAEGLDRNVPTDEQIVQYIKNYPFHMTAKQTYLSKPTATTTGQLDATDAVNTLNLIRLLSGTTPVNENTSFSDLAQSATFIMNKSNQFSHYLNVPANMSAQDMLYRKGEWAARNSNMCYGYQNVAQSLMYGYMYDKDDSNIDRVGHRRWLINPTLRAVGFGQVDAYTATYVLDNKAEVAKELPNVYEWSTDDLAEQGGYRLVKADEKIAWPAENMPIQYMQDDVPFSLSLGDEYDIVQPVVTVENKSTGQTEVIDGANVGAKQFMTTNETVYGYLQALIWRTNPSKFHYQAGETYAIHIDGIMKNGVSTPIDYDVSFFDLEKYIPEMTAPQAYTVVEGETFEVDAQIHYDYSNQSKIYESYATNSNYLEQQDDTHYKALKAGKTKLKTYAGDDDPTFVTVTIQPNPTWAKSIQAASTITLKKGGSKNIKATVLPTTAPQTVTYKVANKNIATVSKNGKVVGKKKGKTTVTITGTRQVKKKVTIVVK